MPNLEEQEGTHEWLLCLGHREQATEGRENTSQTGAKGQEPPLSVVQGRQRPAPDPWQETSHNQVEPWDAWREKGALKARCPLNIGKGVSKYGASPGEDRLEGSLFSPKPPEFQNF